MNVKNTSSFTNDMLFELQNLLETGETIEVIEKLTGDASSREYFRVRSTKSSYILQTHPLQNSYSETAQKLFSDSQAILSFFQIPTPQIFAQKPSLGWVLMEDLGARTLQLEPQVEHFKEAIDLIGKLYTVQNASVPPLLKNAKNFSWAFDFEKLQWEMAYTAEHLFEKYWKLSGSVFLDAIQSNSQFLSRRPRVFCHRDYHSRNLMIHKNHLYMIDFQDARWGPITYDLASLLEDPYAKLSSPLKQSLFLYWNDHVLNPFAKDHPEFLVDLEEEYSRMLIQRFLKAAGSYASFLNLKGRSDYLEYIHPALEVVKTAFKSLEAQTKLSPEDCAVITLLEKDPHA